LLEDGSIIYSNTKSKIGLPTIITITNSENLNSYDINWPTPKSKNESGINYSFYDNKIDIPILIEPKNNEEDVILNFKISYLLCNDYGCFPKEELKNFRGKFAKITANSSKESYQTNVFILYFYAFLGGFILNLMPCVLPVLSLKLFSLVKARSPLERRIESILSILTIMIFFLFLGFLTVKAKDLGEYFIPGFNLQTPPVIITCMIFITITISLLREKIIFNVDIPFKESKIRYFNVIATTLISTILATPCTAPFLVSSMAYALSQESEIILLMFFLTSLGFSLPYFAVIVNPNIISFLPKSGAWQEKIKHVFLLLLLATLAWLFWILSSQLGYLPAISALLLLYFTRAIIENQIKFYLKIFAIFVVTSLSFAIPLITKENFSKIDNIKNSLWESFSFKKFEEYKANNEIILVYATADWCITCKVNKLMVLDRPDTILMLKKYKVKVLEIDLTNKNQEGNIFLKSYNSSGIPFAIIINGDKNNNIVLPTILSYGNLEESISKIQKKVNK
jgi:thiol:disulfide interchange protein